ncbi:MAG: N-acetyltransferase [Candidatus Omnitrophica bacterium]|nr:N-acetyltransferase [Candidatus Omnitrophota bacterium]
MIRKITVKDAAAVQVLINKNSKLHAVLPRSLNDIYENLRDFFVYHEDNNILGCCALHITWDNLAEIRSLIVDESIREKGVGSQLVDACCSEAKQLKVKKIFLLTAKPDFFKKLGFKIIDKAELPHKIWNDCLNCIQFPECNEDAMVREIE